LRGDDNDDGQPAGVAYYFSIVFCDSTMVLWKTATSKDPLMTKLTNANAASALR